MWVSRWLLVGMTAMVPWLAQADAQDARRLRLSLGPEFATAAGYVAHAICASACLPRH